MKRAAVEQPTPPEVAKAAPAVPAMESQAKEAAAPKANSNTVPTTPAPKPKAGDQTQGAPKATPKPKSASTEAPKGIVSEVAMPP